MPGVWDATGTDLSPQRERWPRKSMHPSCFRIMTTAPEGPATPPQRPPSSAGLRCAYGSSIHIAVALDNSVYVGTQGMLVYCWCGLLVHSTSIRPLSQQSNLSTLLM